MSPEFKILSLLGWEISKVKQDDKSRHPANLLLPDERYWFFKYWDKKDLKVDVMGLGKNAIITRKLLRFYLWLPFKALLKASKYDLILCFHSQVGLPLAFMMWLLNIKTPLVIIDVEGFGRKHRGWQRWFISQVLKRVSLVFYLAKIQKEDYAKHYPEILNRIEFLPLGVDLSRFPYTRSKTEDYILSIGYQGSDFRNWKTLINAYNLLKTKTKLVIVGRTNFTYEAVGSSSLENVEFVDMCSLPKLNEYVSKCKFVVLPLTDRRQALGQMTLLGAMALGKPVIVPEVPGVKDYITDNQDGIFYQPGNVSDLAEKIQYLLDNPDVAGRLGKEAKNSAETKFSDENMSFRIFETLKNRGLLKITNYIDRCHCERTRLVGGAWQSRYYNQIASPSVRNDIQGSGEIALPSARNDSEGKNEIASPAKRRDHNDKNDKPAPENILLLGFGYYPFRISGDKNFWLDLSQELSNRLDKIVVISVNSSPIRFEQRGNIWLYNILRPFHRKKDSGKTLNFQFQRHPLPWEILERSATMLKLLPLLRKLVKLHNIRVIHLMDNFGFSTGLVKLFFPKIKICATAITYNTHNFPLKPYGSYQRMTLGNLDKLVVSCKAYKERLIEHGFARDKLEVIRWGIPAPNRKLKVAHKKPRLSSSNKVVLWTGFTQQIREKSFQLSLSLAQKITSQKSCIDFVFALKSECYDKAYEYFQNEHLLIITTDSESFMKLLDRVDVLLAPVIRLRSIIAPPLTWIECMARGIPIISTQAPGIDEILIHNQTGFVAKSNEELESLIEKVLEDKDLMSEVSINAKELVKEKYNLKDIAQDYLRLWRENVGATLSS